MLPQFELYRPTNLLEACRLKAQGAVEVAGVLMCMWPCMEAS